MSNEVFLNEWIDFQKNIIPKDAPLIQKIEMRRAFYAGALSFFSLVTLVSSIDNEELSLLKVDSLFKELTDFKDIVGKNIEVKDILNIDNIGLET